MYLQKLTEARKAIIELIEPFMNKTLSEGCLVLKNNGIMKVKHNELYEGSNIICFTNGLLVTEIELIYDKLSKILGHYDITAVLKYINKGENFVLLGDNGNKIEIHNRVAGDIGYFTTKPLYLYTEEEDKLLLELLKKL